MLFALDAIPLTEPLAGVGHYTLELTRALAHVAPAARFELLYPAAYPPIRIAEAEPPSAQTPRTNEPAALAPNLSVIRVPAGVLGRRWWSVGLPLYLRRHNVALFHGTNFEVPLRGNATRVVTIHDLSLLARPETHERRRVWRARLRLPLMARRADAVITPTEAVRREAIERFRLPAAKVFAVPEAARERFRPLAFGETAEARRRLGAGDEFILAVGTIEPRKNLPTLLRAFEEILRARPRPGLRLVLAGRAGWMRQAWLKQLEGSPARDRVVHTGYVSDADLCALYSSCRLFVYPSLYEGFGLPPLEAMQCGAPVIAARVAAVAEVAGDAARLFEPESSEELARALSELLDDEAARGELSARGLRRAAQFSWEQTARRTLSVYAEAAALRRGSGRD
jgi:glycosyltransferase involved in cell wall biosynthesis